MRIDRIVAASLVAGAALAIFWRKDGLQAEPAVQYDASAQTILILLCYKRNEQQKGQQGSR
jgi:hypothetical protein